MSRLLGRLVLVVVLLGGLLIAGDSVATHLADQALAHRAEQATGAARATVSLEGFPVLGHLLVQGEVPEVRATLEDVPVHGLTLEQVAVQLHDVRIGRRQLLEDHRLSIEAIGSADARAVVTQAELSAALGHPVELPGRGVVETDVLGVPVAVQVAVEDGDQLVLQTPVLPLLRVDLGIDPFLSACQLGLSVQVGQVVATCVMDPVPAGVVAALAS